jgi:hypothetical protein
MPIKYKELTLDGQTIDDALNAAKRLLLDVFKLKDTGDLSEAEKTAIESALGLAIKFGEGKRSAQQAKAEAKGDDSTALGDGTVATGAAQVVIGKFNESPSESEEPDTTNAFIIGNGTSETRSNAATIDWGGNATFAGNLTTKTVVLGENQIKIGNITLNESQLENIINLIDTIDWQGGN